jgi:cytochrome c oxidase subunit 2
MKGLSRSFVAPLIGAAAALWTVLPGWAQQPRPWEMGMQPAASPVKAQIISLHNLVLIIITIITLFVAALLAVVVYRFRASKNPVPSRTSHNTVLEIAWTLFPVLVLIVIAIPSFRLVYYEDRTRDADLTIKVTGHQWYWEYTYPDKGNIDFNSNLVQDEDLKPGQPRLLTADNELVLPVGKNVRILMSSGDVIHSFFIPSLGVQRYAIAGRLIETWVRIDRPGTYYGECNQICGENHSRMPIEIRGVSPQEFDTWLTEAKSKYADAAPPAAASGAKDGFSAGAIAPQRIAEIQH